MEKSSEMSGEDLREQYSRQIKRKLLFIIVCFVLSLVAIGSSVSVGGRTLSMTEVYSVIFDHIRGIKFDPDSSRWLDDFVIWNIRVPRALFAVIAGCGLAVSGAAMQSVMKNPLADPYTTGISSGACFGVAVSSALGLSIMSATNDYGVSTVNSFVFALVPTMAIMFLAPKEKMSPATLILAGQAISYLFNALTTILLSFLEAETLATIYEWEVGTFKYITWDSIAIPFIVTLSGGTLLMFLSKKLNIMALGDAQATTLGLSVEQLRITLLVVVALISASIISYAGIIGFIGLISPHIVRLVIGSDNRFVLPGAAMFGATFLLVCDIVSRLISNLDAVPVGIIISFIGAPIFLILIIKQRRSMW